MTHAFVRRAFLSFTLCLACPPPTENPPTPPGSPAEQPAPPLPALGATRTLEGASFKVYSSAASRITLELYAQPLDTPPVGSVELSHGTDGVWTAELSTEQLAAMGLVGDALYYGFRAWGPNWPFVSSWRPGKEDGFVADVDSLGNRFNPNKLLSDPYGRELSHDPIHAGNLDGRWFASGPSHRALDSAAKAPKSVLFASPAGALAQAPNRPLRDDVIYEVHLRGLTAQDPNVPAELRGTYAGAALKATELAQLGVTAVEFLPVQETQNDANDVDPKSADGDNYWGYMTLGYFAPDRRYAADRSAGGPTREFRAMVEAFHARGIKVFIDVVYNHTGEGGAWGGDFRTHNVLSFRGLDNATYYSLSEDRRFSYDNTGVGGNFNTRNAVAQNLIVDSLRYWHSALGVDGFRFDLASVLGNACEHGCFAFDKLNPDTALNRIPRALPVRSAEGGEGVDLIAEPWAIGAYQVGEFPRGWAEWNGRFRDTFRRKQNLLGVEEIPPAELARRFAGSADLYADDGRVPGHSINFLTAHDGFTLADLYGCNAKNNAQAWPFGPSDGGEDHNNSWDQGANLIAQRQAARTGMMLLMLSAGTPMLNAGDERLRSLRCNNNPYNVDSEGNWLQPDATAEQQRFREFTARLIAFRRAHPALRPAHYAKDADHNSDGMGELEWFAPDGGSARGAFMDAPGQHALAYRLDGIELHDSAPALYVAYNAGPQAVDFSLPALPNGRSWHLVAESCARAGMDPSFALPGAEQPLGAPGAVYSVCGRGVMLAIAK